MEAPDASDGWVGGLLPAKGGAIAMCMQVVLERCLPSGRRCLNAICLVYKQKFHNANCVYYFDVVT